MSARDGGAAKHDDMLVGRICERVYRDRLGDDAARMVAKDADGGEKLRRRAMGYENTVRATLGALRDEPLGATIQELLSAGQKMLATREKPALPEGDAS